MARRPTTYIGPVGGGGAAIPFEQKVLQLLEQLNETSAPADTLLASGAVSLAASEIVHLPWVPPFLIEFWRATNTNNTDAGTAANLYYWYGLSQYAPANQKFTLTGGDTRAYTTRPQALTVKADSGATAGGVEYEVFGNARRIARWNELQARRAV